jgi:PIN domain associated with the TPR-GreAB-C-PIN system
LAHVGCAALPRLDEVRTRDPDHAEVLLAMAEMYSGQLQSAAARLRPLTGRNRMAALQLAETYHLQSRPEQAAELLAQTGERFSDARLLVQAARHYLLLEDHERFRHCTEVALPLAHPPSPIRREIRWLQVEEAAKRQDAAAIEASASTALAEGEDRPDLRWLRAEALIHLHRLKDAWSELRREPKLTPGTEPRARLFLQLLMRREPSALQLMADVLDVFADAHDVHATGISLFLAFGANEDRDPAGVEAMQAHVARFIERYPDSSVLRSQDVNTDDPEELRQQMRKMLDPDPERDRLRQHLAEQALLGQIPMGFAASMLGRAHLEVLLNGTGVGFTTVPLDGVLAEEVQIATATLDQPVVADVSTLVAMTFAPTLWTSALAAFSTISIATTTFAEVNDSTFAKAPSGSVSWDHEQDTFVFTPVSDEQLEAITRQRAQVREWAAELQITPTGQISELPGGEALKSLNESSTWADGITAAHAKQCGLLCDDVALAAFARSVGAPAFGSFALFVALARAGRITADQIDDLVEKLYMAQADDLPLSPIQLTSIAIARDWPLNAAIHPMVRPAYWRDLETAISAFSATINGFRQTTNAPGRTLYAATIGVIRAIVVGSPLPLIGRLFAAATLQVASDPEEVTGLVAAMRAACNGRELDDPYPVAVRALIEVSSSTLDAAQLAMFVTTAFSSLGQADRTTAASIVLE